MFGRVDTRNLLTDLLTKLGRTWETRRDTGDGQRDTPGRRRRGETRVVWLITQRSRVQIPPCYQGQKAFLKQRKAFCMRFVHGMLARSLPELDNTP